MNKYIIYSVVIIIISLIAFNFESILGIEKEAKEEPKESCKIFGIIKDFDIDRFSSGVGIGTTIHKTITIKTEDNVIVLEDEYLEGELKLGNLLIKCNSRHRIVEIL